MLANAKERAIGNGVTSPESKQRHGELLESLQALEDEIRLLVIGRQGESSGSLSQHVGSQLESDDSNHASARSITDCHREAETAKAHRE